MNEDLLNTSIRKFLKEVGVTSQREIEKAVRDAVADGRLTGRDTLPAKMTLTVMTLGRILLTAPYITESLRSPMLFNLPSLSHFSWARSR